MTSPQSTLSKTLLIIIIIKAEHQSVRQLAEIHNLGHLRYLESMKGLCQ